MGSKAKDNKNSLKEAIVCKMLICKERLYLSTIKNY